MIQWPQVSNALNQDKEAMKWRDRRSKWGILDSEEDDEHCYDQIKEPKDACVQRELDPERPTIGLQEISFSTKAEHPQTHHEKTRLFQWNWNLMLTNF